MENYDLSETFRNKGLMLTKIEDDIRKVKSNDSGGSGKNSKSMQRQMSFKDKKPGTLRFRENVMT